MTRQELAVKIQEVENTLKDLKAQFSKSKEQEALKYKKQWVYVTCSDGAKYVMYITDAFMDDEDPDMMEFLGNYFCKDVTGEFIFAESTPYRDATLYIEPNDVVQIISKEEAKEAYSNMVLPRFDNLYAES